MKEHQNTIGKSDEWLTPPEIIEQLGNFDLDPANAVNNPFKTAQYSWTEGGLNHEWFGRVWLNPPFNRYERPKWMQKMSEHNNGIMLIPAACETDAFYKYVWERASAVLFLKGRPHFYKIDGSRAKANSGCTICLVAYGDKNAEVLEKSKLGKTILLLIPSCTGEARAKHPIDAIPNQLCPKCEGQGTVSKPPFISGDINSWIATEGQYECNLCHGKMIIPMHTKLFEYIDGDKTVYLES